MEVVFVATVSHGWQAAESKAVLPVCSTTGILTAVQTSSICKGQDEHFTDPNTGCPLNLNSAIF